MPLLLASIVFFTALAGMLGAPWWAAVVGGCALALYMLHDDRKAQLTDGEAAILEIAQTISAALISLVAAPTAFLTGQATAMLWGLPTL